MVARYLNDPENKIGLFSRENGIPESSLRSWIREAECGILGGMDKPKHYRYWTLTEKFSAIIDYEKLPESEQGKWLRKHGILKERIDEWKKELQTSLSIQDDKKKKNSPENQKIKKLEKELERKDKALAEASALLFAKKKLDTIFGENEEEE